MEFTTIALASRLGLPRPACSHTECSDGKRGVCQTVQGACGRNYSNSKTSENAIFRFLITLGLLQDGCGHWVCDEQLRCSTRSMEFVMNSYAVLFMSIRSGWTDMLFSTTVQRGSLRVTLHVPFACVNAVKPIGG